MFSKLFIAVTTLMPILAMAAPQVDTTIHASLWSEPDRGGPQQNILDTNCHDLDLNQYASQSIVSADELYTDGISTASTTLAQRKPFHPMPAIYMGTSNSTFRTF
ncbi:hypothetical protein AtubIFM56815_002614 [Aspergillus tubingensis]|uniref:Uncharacterized protein n=1 Tax=Aspergillus tubingensis TaxID=5068 RepID=A0A9W6AVB7_ASPTU|nr:hypothetical protein AtubIFM54640_001770 [Aspergillus tubingensis]GLA88172.1 hypothetical protein AtubIFM56815_002614 [Aspergillus tubingensis]